MRLQAAHNNGNLAEFRRFLLCAEKTAYMRGRRAKQRRAETEAGVFLLLPLKDVSFIALLDHLSQQIKLLLRSEHNQHIVRADA